MHQKSQLKYSGRKIEMCFDSLGAEEPPDNLDSGQTGSWQNPWHVAEWVLMECNF